MPASAPLAAIMTCAGTTLSAWERAFFRDADPLGFILFAINIEAPDQVRALTGALREAVGREAPILIDQEGGRVARLRPPHWRAAAPARRFGELAERDEARAIEAVRVNARLLAAELHDVGLDVDCAPVVDLSIPGAHDVIGDRAFGGDPGLVARLGRAFAEGLGSGGVMPMMKHVPGHGRAMADSHKALPAVDLPMDELARTDFLPFRLLSDLPAAMTAHILYPQIDPQHPATTSPAIVEGLIRGHMGFDGLLFSDDINMEALSGGIGEKARAIRAAGCDVVLHCWPRPDEMQELAGACGPMDAAGLARLAEAREWVAAQPEPVDVAALSAELVELMAG